MERDEALQSLLVQLSKLQVALRRVSAERDSLKSELAEQASSQQQCLQLLLDARQQLQTFQVDLGRVRDSNEQLAAHNLRLQQAVQQLQSQTQQQQQLNSKQHTSQQQCEQQEPPAQHTEALSRMTLLSHLATTWHNRTDLPHGDSSTSSSGSSSKRMSPTSSTSGRTDTPDVGVYCGCKSLQETQAGGGVSTTSNLQKDLLCRTTQSQGQQLQHQHQHQLQQPFPEAEPTHTHEDVVQDAGLQQEHSSCSLPRPAKGLPVVQPADVCWAGRTPSTVQLVLQPSESATAVPTAQQQPAEASASAAVTASDGVVHLTQQQLDYIMAEVEQLQHKLAQTTAKLGSVVAQPMTSHSLLQQEARPQQHHQQQGSCVSLQIGDQPISEWHQQLEQKQQQLQDRQQQVLGLQQPTQQQQLQRCNHKHRQCVAANCRRLYQQQHHQQQQQHLCELLTPQCHSSKPSWNYQNSQVQQEQRQRRQLRRDAIRLRAQKYMHLHQEHTAAALQCTQENRPLAPQQQQQHRQRQGQQAEMQHCTHQQQHNRDPQGSGCIVTAAATAENIITETLETPPTAAVAAAASSCLQLEGSWVSSADSSGQSAAGAGAGAGPATTGLTNSLPTHTGSQAVASPAETVVFMQPICIRGPGVLHALHG